MTSRILSKALKSQVGCRNINNNVATRVSAANVYDPSHGSHNWFCTHTESVSFGNFDNHQYYHHHTCKNNQVAWWGRTQPILLEFPTFNIINRRQYTSSSSIAQSTKNAVYKDNDDMLLQKGGQPRQGEDSIIEGKQRLWLDPKTSLKDRVTKFLNSELGSLHPLDVQLASFDLIRQCGKLRSFEGMQLAHDILDRLLEEKRYMFEQHAQNIIIPERVFKVLMYGWSNMTKKAKSSTQRMREVLDIMITESEFDDKFNKANISKNNDNDMSVSESSNNNDEKIDKESQYYADTSCQPTVDTYNTLLQGLSEASYRSISIATEAEHILDKMERMHTEHGWFTKPTTKSYACVITAFARSQHVTAGTRAETILRRVIHAHQKEKEDYYNQFGVEYNAKNTTANYRRIVTPDAGIYTAVIQAYKNSSGGGDNDPTAHTLRLLLEMVQSKDDAIEADSFVFTNVIDSFAARTRKKASAKARFEAASRAEEILWLLVDEIKRKKETIENESNENTENNDNDMMPTSQETATLSSSSSLLSSSTNNNQKRNVGLTGNVAPFNACLKAWAHSDTKEATDRAESLLSTMLDPDFQQLTNIKPTIVSFNTVLHAWARKALHDPTAPQHAEDRLEALLESCKHQEENIDGTRVAPDTLTYITVMNAYARSSNPQKVFHVRRIFESLISNVQSGTLHGNMDAVPFTVVLNAAAHTPKHLEANDSDMNINEYGFDVSQNKDDDNDYGNNNADFDDSNIDPYSIAMETYNELLWDKYNFGVSPDHHVFATMLQVINVHTELESIERRQQVEQIFQDAKNSGHVSSLVIQSLKLVCPSKEMLGQLLENSDLAYYISSIHPLPKHWTRNVPMNYFKVTSYNPQGEKRQQRRKRKQEKKKNEGSVSS